MNKYKFEYYALIILVKLLNLIGLFSIKIPSSLIALFFYHILSIRKNVVHKNLRIAFPELDQSEIKKLAFENYKSLAITLLEIFKIERMSKEEIEDFLADKGFEIIHDKLRMNKGLILLTGHFGNWELCAVSTGVKMKKSISVLVKKQKNPYVAKRMTSIRQFFGNKEIMLGTSVREIYRAIMGKEIVGLVGDQRGTKDSVKVKFFGKDTYTFPGTAAIALKTGCPVVVMLGARQSNGKYRVEFREIKHDNFTGSEDEKIIEFNQRYMKILEDVVRSYPEQWFWMHNIWKY